MKSSTFSLVATLGVCVLVFGLIWGIGAVTVNESGAADATTAMGFSQVEVESSGFMFTGFRGCDEKDFSWYKVKAVNANGDDVTLRVCRGLFKGYTVRVK